LPDGADGAAGRGFSEGGVGVVGVLIVYLLES
jgi:hypothetical protein